MAVSSGAVSLSSQHSFFRFAAQRGEKKGEVARITATPAEDVGVFVVLFHLPAASCVMGPAGHPLFILGPHRGGCGPCHFPLAARAGRRRESRRLAEAASLELLLRRRRQLRCVRVLVVVITSRRIIPLRWSLRRTS